MKKKSDFLFRDLQHFPYVVSSPFSADKTPPPQIYPKSVQYLFINFLNSLISL